MDELHATPPGSVTRVAEALMLEPLLEPLEGAFGPYGALATQEFTQLLSQAQERGDGR